MVQWLALSGLAVLLAAQSASASSTYVRGIPNGNVNRCATCHEKSGPPDLNKFGESFFSANCKWTPALAAEDSDHDGIANGLELGDPAGTWKADSALPWSLTRVSRPGDSCSKPEPMSRFEALATPVVTWMGHFHPVFVHIPIGGLLLIGFLEVVALFPRLRGATQPRSLLLGLTLAGTLPAVACGWLLSQSGSYETDLMRWHKWTGLALLAACMITWAFSLSRKQRSYQVSLWATVLLLFVASHDGGSLTHGRDFLSLKLPAAVEPGANPQTAANLDPGKFAESN